MTTTFFCQHTILREVECKGLGLHSGAVVTMRLKPAATGFGVRFRRMDLPDQPTIVAHHEHVVGTVLATRIGTTEASVSTIEHLMAALWGSNVDNVLVELDGPEIPIFDGSAARYLELLEEAGVKEQRSFRPCLRVKKPFSIEEGDAYIRAKPAADFRVRYTIDFSHPLVGRQVFTWSFSKAGFNKDLAKARTFGFLKDLEKVRSLGLARGGSLANTIVLDDHKVLNKDGFRFDDECVRHKVLDFLGDIALAGMPIFGHFEAYKAGHALHNRLLKALVRKAGNYTSLAPAYGVKPFFGGALLPDFAGQFPSP